MNVYPILATATKATAAATKAAAAASATAAQEPTTGEQVLSLLISFGPLVLIFVVMYFLMIRPQKKKQKEEQKMRDDVRVGDEIVTIGGICGRVVSVKEDSLTIETGSDRSKMAIMKWALQSNNTKHDTPAPDDDDDDDDDI